MKDIGEDKAVCADEQNNWKWEFKWQWQQTINEDLLKRNESLKKDITNLQLRMMELESRFYNETYEDIKCGNRFKQRN